MTAREEEEDRGNVSLVSDYTRQGVETRPKNGIFLMS